MYEARATDDVHTKRAHPKHPGGDLIEEIIALRKLSTAALRERYFEVFGEETTNRNKVYLFKHIAYRLQERKHGGLTERAIGQAHALADQAPVRRCLSRSVAPAVPDPNRDPRLPPPGALLRRSFGGVEHTVVVREGWFEYRAGRYESLSAIAREITGTRWNGFGFFGLLPKENP